MTRPCSVQSIATLLVPLFALTAAPVLGGQAPAPSSVTPAPGSNAASAPAVPKGVQVPADYVIGPEDVLTIVFWREKDLSSDVVVRPDGRISLPVLQDVQAAGLTPEQLRDSLTKTAERYVEDPNVTVVVKDINSRRVFITGQVAKPGPYNITSPMTVLQLIAFAGGLLEYADGEHILIVRVEKDAPVSYRFNYKEITRQRNLKQNVMLKPGDTVVVP